MIAVKKIKNMAKEIFHSSGLPELMLRRNRGRLCILCYHRITDSDNGYRYLGISQDFFEQQILFLMKHFRILPFSEALERFKKASIKDPVLVLTFDDGYRDNYAYAFPILKKYGISGTIFLTTDFIGTERKFWWNIVADIILNSPACNVDLDEKVAMIENINRSLRRNRPEERENKIERLKEKYGFRDSDAKETEVLSWEEIKEMHRYGIEFGSHTLTHPDLTSLNRDEAKKEIFSSKEILEDVLGKDIHGFAYPYGSYTDDVKDIVRESGYSYARSGWDGFNTFEEDVFALRRIDGLVDRLQHFAVRLSCRGFRV